MLFAIFDAVSRIFPQGILFNAAFSFSPTIDPISVKSAVFHASLIRSAILLNLLSTSTVSNISPGEIPPSSFPEFSFELSSSLFS